LLVGAAMVVFLETSFSTVFSHKFLSASILLFFI
jgi:hypothetical protein